MKTCTMVVRHGLSKDNITGFTLVSSDYQTKKLSYAELTQYVAQKQLVVTNMQFVGGVWKSTNGAMDNYTLINDQTNMVEGTPRAVILDRAEINGKLTGYAVFTQNGTIVHMSVADAVMLANNKMLSNGKVRHTDSGDIVSAIGGNYPLRELKRIEDAPKGTTSVEIMFFGQAVLTSKADHVNYFGAIINCTSAVEMTKLSDKLSKSNAEVIGHIVQTAGQKARKSLAVQRMGANGIYGVFKVSDLKILMESGAKVTLKSGSSVLVSVIKYATDNSADVEDQSVYTVNIGGSAQKKEEAYDTKLEARAKDYCKRVAGIIDKLQK